jgi:voltage-gated potassium channel
MKEQQAAPSPGYQVFMLILSVFALSILGAQATVRLRPSTVEILQFADLAICVLFLADFILQFARAKNRRQYFFSWGWIDLLSSIPVVDAARWGRLVRILRIFRILRAARLATNLVIHRKAENAALVASMVALILVTFASIAILHFETAAESNIATAGDALWWAFATITTVGYGDRYPVTAEGRLVAIVLMSAGVGLFGTFSAFLAAWFVGEGRQDSTSAEIRALRSEIAELRATLASPRGSTGLDEGTRTRDSSGDSPGPT